MNYTNAVFFVFISALLAILLTHVVSDIRMHKKRDPFLMFFALFIFGVLSFFLVGAVANFIEII